MEVPLTFEQFWKAFIAEVDLRAFSAKELADGRHSKTFIGSIDWHRAAAKAAWGQPETDAAGEPVLGVGNLLCCHLGWVEDDGHCSRCGARDVRVKGDR